MNSRYESFPSNNTAIEEESIQPKKQEIYNPGQPVFLEQEQIILDILSIVLGLVDNILSGDFKFDWLSLQSKKLKNSYSFDPETLSFTQNDTKPSSSLNLLSSISHTTSLVRLFEIILNSLLDDKVVKKRELYYLDPQLFKSQDYVDQILKEITLAIQTPRKSLNIVASNKGLVAGNLCIFRNNQIVELSQTFTHSLQVYNVNNLNEHIEYLITNAQLVLIVEKETVFYYLLTPQLIEKLGPLILITGKGYPDLETKYFLANFHKRFPEIPLFFLGDCDPYGIDILCQYVFSNEHTIFEDCRSPDINWLGVFPEDIEDQKDNFCKMKLKKNDNKKLDAILKRPYFDLFQKNESLEIMSQGEKIATWRERILMMKKTQEKAEIEALYEGSNDGLITYLYNKLY